MRECWINVYVNPARNWTWCGVEWASREKAALSSDGAPGFFVYRLHVRLKVPALPATDALAAVMAGEDENGRAA
ncbi:hypothetical protein JRF84_08270 [Methylobacterium organophilum]|uniref:hypothetical protein n=1 Tax=Methylobacterium TaxID=407 RepID=UPI0019CF9F6C|nr:hypothetical protein [Methylobacterium organophilum]MBN6819584.1 hypothetical protein [Methylobacterium organophilum]